MASQPPQNQPADGVVGTSAGDVPLPIIPDAMQLRAQWLREWGRTEEEIAALCQPDKHPGTLAEEELSLQAVRRLKAIDVDRLFPES